MPDINKCVLCGKFKSWEKLQSCAGDSDDLGGYEHWFECSDCLPKPLKASNGTQEGEE